jgi:hypothetical protein
MSLRCLKILSLAALTAGALPALAAQTEPPAPYDNDDQMSVQVPLRDVDLSS